MCCFEKVIFGRLEVKSTNHINNCNKLTSILLSVIILKVRLLSLDVTSLDYTYLTGPFSYELFDALRQKLFASLDAITGLVQRRVNTLSSKCPSNLSRFATFTRNFHLLNEFLLILPKLRRNSYFYYFSEHFTNNTTVVQNWLLTRRPDTTSVRHDTVSNSYPYLMNSYCVYIARVHENTTKESVSNMSGSTP